ncbi:hypothetical protein SAMN04487977_101567 [Treponema bryantii]|uniref:Uncharacterized protein n=1 Tax=Treponema bryantii TaxID=163 RepID=A0A1H9B4H3_9SPIR|nr:hypothetical protein [Treponema bryantii]SEP83621.1 hypothetical protein SAMN04487977_101567 [Treponema bryantii]
MQRVVIQTNREGYPQDQIRKTMTVSELRDYLQELESQNPTMPVYLRFDNNYTYGGITERCIEVIDDEEEI